MSEITSENRSSECNAGPVRRAWLRLAQALRWFGRTTLHSLSSAIPSARALSNTRSTAFDRELPDDESSVTTADHRKYWRDHNLLIPFSASRQSIAEAIELKQKVRRHIAELREQGITDLTAYANAKAGEVGGRS